MLSRQVDLSPYEELTGLILLGIPSLRHLNMMYAGLLMLRMVGFNLNMS